jgi:import inner membrane translocase subunit TIM17
MYYDKIPDYRYRVIDYVGDGILMGLSLGTPFYFIRGLCRSPIGGRLAGGAHAVRTNVPRFAGRTAGQLAVFSALESAMSLARHRRDDYWNGIVASTATFGLLDLHRGAPAAARSALLAGTLMAGLAGLELSFFSWHSGLVGSGRKVQWQGLSLLPAVVPVKRTPCRAALRDAGGSIENR